MRELGEFPRRYLSPVSSFILCPRDWDAAPMGTCVSQAGKNQLSGCCEPDGRPCLLKGAMSSFAHPACLLGGLCSRAMSRAPLYQCLCLGSLDHGHLGKACEHVSRPWVLVSILVRCRFGC